MAEERNQNTAAAEQDLSEILQVRRDKLAALRAEGRDPFQETKFDVTHHAQDIKDNFDALEGSEVRIAGRLMSKRGMGKVSFCDLQDKSGRIQLYARKDEMDEEEYDRFKKYDIGDIVGVDGEVFRTQRGEMSVRAKTITLLSKMCIRDRCSMATVALNTAKSYYEEKHDKTSFVKSILSDNILLRDVYKRQELRRGS